MGEGRSVAAKTKRRLDVMKIKECFHQKVDEDEDHDEVSHELTGNIAIIVGIDAQSRIDHYAHLAFPNLHGPMDWFREVCEAKDHSLCGMSIEGLLLVMSRTFADALADELEQKAFITKCGTWGDPSKFYDCSPLTPTAHPDPIKDDYRIRRAAPEVEKALKNMVNRLVDHHRYDKGVVESWIADASSLAAAQLIADMPKANEVGIDDWWNVALEWLSRIFALVWQREVRTLAREP